MADQNFELCDSLKLALDTIPFGADIVDEEGRILFMNSNMRALFGEVQNRKCWELYKDDKAQCDSCPLKKRFELGKTRSLESDHVGGGRSFSITHTGIICEGRKAYLEVFQDVTKYREMEKRLNRQLFALQSAANAIIITKNDGTIVWVNNAFTGLTGYLPEEVIGKTPRILKSGNHDLSFYQHLWGTLLSGKVWKGEIINRRKDGGTYVDLMTVTPLFEKGEIVNFIAIKQDITERKRMEEEVVKLNQDLKWRADELLAANRELEAFSYSASHDLRAPLRGIDGFSKILEEEYGGMLDDRGREYLKRTRMATQRMGQLIDDILNLSRITRASLVRENVDLSSMAKEIALKLRESEPERQVDFVIAGGLSARCDKSLMRLALDNLFGNAWKFTSGSPKSRIEFGCFCENSEKVYFVRDDGAGFDMDYAGKLFIPFQRLHSESEFKGSGVGLSIVYRIVYKHGGRIWAEGHVGKGASFYFTLPG
ncbi:PAS domain S-box protein [Candidatus Woesearchaeota archaeon]|nr:PAS domain S-box protein [Candidatus Woesearchaeota archaeon]